MSCPSGIESNVLPKWYCGSTCKWEMVVQNRNEEEDNKAPLIQQQICIFFNVWKIQVSLRDTCTYDDRDYVICCMAKEMKGKFEKCSDSYSLILSFAVILDPRYKFCLVEFCYTKLYGQDGFRKAKKGYSRKRERVAKVVRSSPGRGISCSSERVLLRLDESRLGETTSPEREHQCLGDAKSRGLSPKRAFSRPAESTKT
ncbi:hypothetical protein Lal_00025956 [Lupinus albus]|nr:hypothetical protein Lal_00025956 [Lupinus albus]